jgi:hemoglobin-like flavoprotein
MQASQIALVRSSFERLAPRADAVACGFYQRLFALQPQLRALFPRELGNQGVKLMHVLGLAVAGLDRLPTLAPTLRELGRRHGGYGVEDAHYDWVGQALIRTLEQELADGFTPEVRAAWTETYAALAGEMKAGAAA